MPLSITVSFASSMALAGTGEQVSEQIAGLAALGLTEVVYQPGRIRHWLRAPLVAVVGLVAGRNEGQV